MALLLVPLLALLITACGLPTNDQPVDDGDVPQSTNVDPGGAPPILRPDGVENARELVKRYFGAAAVGGDDAVSRLREFYSGKTKAEFKPGKAITLVDAQVRPPTVTTGVEPVVVDITPIGLLVPDGTVGPLGPDPVPTKLQFTFEASAAADPGRVQRQTLLLAGPPTYVSGDDAVPYSGMMLSTDWLATNFTAQTIYFWADEGGPTPQFRTLVPDVRYQLGSGEVNPSQVLKWLQAGPSAWLRAAAANLLPNTISAPTIDEENGRYVVKLAAGVSTDTARWMATQVRWSIGPSSKQVVARINGVAEDVVPPAADFLAANPFSAQAPNAYGLLGGQVVQVNSGSLNRTITPESEWPQVVRLAKNTKATKAALSQDLASLAFVVPRDGVDYLQVLKQNRDKQQQDPDDTAISGNDMSRPTYLGRTHQLVVVVNGNLYSMVADELKTTMADAKAVVPSALAGNLKTVQASLDGRRLVIVTKQGEVYLATINSEHKIDPHWNLLNPDPTDRTFKAIDAGWSTSTEVMVVGSTRKGGLVSNKLAAVRTDNTPIALSDRAAISAVEVHGLAVRPADPRGSASSYQVLVDLSNSGKSYAAVLFVDELPELIPPVTADGQTSHLVAPFYAG